MASEDCCPLCLEAVLEAGCVLPCCHRFCFKCIVHYIAFKPECPVCKRTVTASWQLLEEVPRRPPAAAESGSRACQPWNLYAGFMGGLQPSSWAFIFRQRPGLLQLLQPWLHEELQHVLGAEHPQVLVLEGRILSTLPVVGLHEERLAELLQAELQGQTTAFVQKLIGFTVERCRRVALLLLGVSPDARAKLKESPGADLCSDVFRRWQHRGPVASTSWAACQEGWEDNLVGSTSPSGFPERRQGSPMASPGPAACQGRWGGDPAASCGPAASHQGTAVPGPAPSSSAAPLGTDEALGPSATAPQGHPSCCPPRKQELLLWELRKAAAALPRGGQGRECSGCARQGRDGSQAGPGQPLERPWGDLPPSAWGFLFRTRPDLLQLLRPWLRWELGHRLGAQHPGVLRLEEMVLSALPVVGLQEGLLVRQLRAELRSHSREVVQRLIAFSRARYGSRARQLLLRGRCQLAAGLEESPGEVICSALFGSRPRRSPAASTGWAAGQRPGLGHLLARPPAAGTPVPTPAPSSSPAPGVPGASSAAPQGHPGCPCSVPAPVPGEQEELLELEEAAAGASGASQGRDCSCQGPQRPLKRKANSPEGSALPAKKQCQQ